MTWDPGLAEHTARLGAVQSQEGRAGRGTSFSSEPPEEVVERLLDPTEDPPWITGPAPEPVFPMSSPGD